MGIRYFNDIDASITLCCLNTEQSLQTVQASHPWSPTLAIAILLVQLWNYVKTKLKTKSIDTSRISSIDHITTHTRHENKRHETNQQSSPTGTHTPERHEVKSSYFAI